MISISFDTTELLDYANDLQYLDRTTLAEMRADAVETVAAVVRERAILDTVAGLNLSRAYVEARIERDTSNARSASQRIVSQVRGTTLQRFGIAQEVKPVRWDNNRIREMGVKIGKWPDWTLRTGDASRGIDEDDKANGISVDVNRKGAKRIATAFTMPLRNDNGIGVFRRENGKVRQLYGPSVYQTFRTYITTNEEAIADSLRRDFMQRLDTLK